MEKAKLNHAHPKLMETRNIDEIRKMSPQHRFDKLMAIIEKSNKWKSKYEYYQHY